MTSRELQEQARQLFEQGISFLQKEQLDPARENLNRALDIAKNINNEDGQHLQVDILNTLGHSYNRPYDWGLAQAIKTCEQSLRIARNIGYRHGEAIALTVIGKAYYWYPGVQRDFPKAIECYKQAKSIFQETQDLGRLMDALYHLQDSYGYTSKYAQAIKTNNERLNIAQQLVLAGEQLLLTEKKQTGEQWVLIGKEQEASALFCLGSNYQDLGEYPEAGKNYEQCLTKAREMDGQQAQWLQVRSLVGVGNINRINGNLNNAINRYQESLKIAKNIDEQGQANTLQALAEIYYYQGNLDDAWSYNERSLEIKRRLQDQIGTGNSIGFQGSISRARGNYDEALNYFNQSLPIMKEVGNGSGIANTLTDVGLTYYYLSRIPEAEQCLSQAIKLWEDIREWLGTNNQFKVSIFEQQARTYQLQQAILIAQQKITEALEVAERGRARAFVELLASRLSPSRTDELTIPPPTLKQIQQIAQERNSTLVEYSIIGSELLFIWVIKPTGEVAFRSVDLKPLSQTNNTLEYLVLLTRNVIGVRGRDWENVEDTDYSDIEQGRLSQILQQLHQVLIQPIADLLPTEDTAKVIFMPQGSLFLIPFPALKDDSDQYLIEKHTILTAPSIQVLQLTRQQQAKVQQAALQEVLVLGNPTMPSVVPPLKPLLGAEQEAIAIAALLQTQAITGSDGTKAVIVKRMSQARIIHLATHGLVDNDRGLGSAIALAPSGNDKGLLTAQEILDLNLNAELVVLSACDTGRGRLTGDGVIGLSRSFIAAGVSSVIVSLWAIPDSPTAELMIKFYEKLKQNADKAQALRQAMLMTVRQCPHPKNWAAFTLIGEWHSD